MHQANGFDIGQRAEPAHSVAMEMRYDRRFAHGKIRPGVHQALRSESEVELSHLVQASHEQGADDEECGGQRGLHQQERLKRHERPRRDVSCAGAQCMREIGPSRTP
jgi:hypothetical protein